MSSMTVLRSLGVFALYVRFGVHAILGAVFSSVPAAMHLLGR
jgi:hypothetical protein